MAVPLGPLAVAFGEVIKLANKWLAGTKGRRTRAGLLAGQRFIKRVKKIAPDLLESGEFADKYLRKYERDFSKNSIRK